MCLKIVNHNWIEEWRPIECNTLFHIYVQKKERKNSIMVIIGYAMSRAFTFFHEQQ
jgi:hypothetical protein